MVYKWMKDGAGKRWLVRVIYPEWADVTLQAVQDLKTNRMWVVSNERLSNASVQDKKG
jgi:hypothetical protein